MKLPNWYKISCGIWMIAAPAFWWFTMGFNGKPLLSLPDPPPMPDDGPLWLVGLVLWLVIIGLLLAPITMLPWALLSSRRFGKNERQTNASN
ncbi:MAG: hypothetical protein H0W65_03975 [Sphingomonas sp.]|uniref:hypothetical protein n=1 Tax=Sphingomonas sp. TaxID=28214 RepID=UPI00181DD403|nr:hypothetical protein [Sphingomonas sp.]MBA3666863.1 hypothetical protein [Sphingomonas sp.]